MMRYQIQQKGYVISYRRRVSVEKDDCKGMRHQQGGDGGQGFKEFV